MRTRVYRPEDAGRVTVTDATKLRVPALVRAKRTRKPVAFTAGDAFASRSSDGSVELTLPKPPSANRYWRVYRGHATKSKEALAYRAMVEAVVARDLRGIVAFTGPVVIRLDWWRRDKVGDLDNLLKCALDSLKGVVYADDKQVARIVAERHDGPYDGRVVINVAALVRDALAAGSGGVLRTP